MPESKSSPEIRRSLTAEILVGVGLLAVSAGAALFHPGAGLILGGLLLVAVGILGGPRKAG